MICRIGELCDDYSNEDELESSSIEDDDVLITPKCAACTIAVQEIEKYATDRYNPVS